MDYNSLSFEIWYIMGVGDIYILCGYFVLFHSYGGWNLLSGPYRSMRGHLFCLSEFQFFKIVMSRILQVRVRILV